MSDPSSTTLECPIGRPGWTPALASSSSLNGEEEAMVLRQRIVVPASGPSRIAALRGNASCDDLVRAQHHDTAIKGK